MREREGDRQEGSERERETERKGVRKREGDREEGSEKERGRQRGRE